MNKQTNTEPTGDDQAVLEKRYAKAKNIAIALFVLCLLCILVFVGGILTALFGDLPRSDFESAHGIALGSIFLGIVSGWAGVFFAARAIYFRSKLHFGSTDSLTDAILAAVVKRVGKNLPAGVIGQAVSQESQRADEFNELSKLKRELADLRREREESEK